MQTALPSDTDSHTEVRKRKHLSTSLITNLTLAYFIRPSNVPSSLFHPTPLLTAPEYPPLSQNSNHHQVQDKFYQCIVFSWSICLFSSTLPFTSSSQHERQPLCIRFLHFSGLLNLFLELGLV